MFLLAIIFFVTEFLLLLLGFWWFVGKISIGWKTIVFLNLLLYMCFKFDRFFMQLLKGNRIF